MMILPSRKVNFSSTNMTLSTMSKRAIPVWKLSKPPSFLDQSIPMWRYDETNQRPPVFQPTHVVPITDGQPHEWMDDSLPSDPDTAAQRDREQFHQQWRERSGDEEVMYPGLHEFLQQLDEEWSEPGSYYPPPMQTMQDVVAMEVD